MNNLIKQTKLLKNSIERLRGELEKAFLNKNIHVGVRWQHFLAWADLKQVTKVGTTIPNLDNILGEEVICYNGIICAERYLTINLIEVAEENIFLHLFGDQPLDDEDSFNKYDQVLESIMEFKATHLIFDW